VLIVVGLIRGGNEADGLVSIGVGRCVGSLALLMVVIDSIVGLVVDSRA
jgi:hypothetical protein